ncbi:MAG: hypothetical protein EWV92_05070 [Microcystis aeruginosa Ma_MB_S_20031200_S102]|jgi:hypothetical protein|uniref:Uncharacterized protein n=1 Tax=Microcystis aeruginosa Ma_MB_S_20031200_S102 TaxID=2486254 RepID=A0A552F1K5_MICAE|nr:MAG: hypothetical protein EWV79_10270 [Microcystis aeruginosa Ma_MB_S_20031200_S102D]TRU40576.1 MAG: hypothetical protein EWV92_05070 [Microcystis aeruginosa Ma_MB_S_20031200_S102]
MIDEFALFQLLFSSQETGSKEVVTDKLRLFGFCYAMDGGYKGWNPYMERHLAIFVNCFLSRAS